MTLQHESSSIILIFKVSKGGFADLLQLPAGPCLLLGLCRLCIFYIVLCGRRMRCMRLDSQNSILWQVQDIGPSRVWQAQYFAAWVKICQSERCCRSSSCSSSWQAQYLVKLGTPQLASIGHVVICRDHSA